MYSDRINNPWLSLMRKYKKITLEDWSSLMARLNKIEKCMERTSMRRDFLTAITPTGDRPEAFALCCMYMARQTRLPDRWLIIDDGKTPLFQVSTPIPSIKGIDIFYVRRVRQPHELAHTLPAQLEQALDYAGERGPFLIIEDDDWYSPMYCERMESMFIQFPGVQLVGQAPAIYYHVGARRIFRLRNKDHASLCQTGFHSGCKEIVQTICKNATTPFIDLELWKQPLFKHIFPPIPVSCVGIKGMPGRTNNATIGHRPDYPRYQSDADLAQLRELIGEDVVNYEKFYRPPTERPL